MAVSPGSQSQSTGLDYIVVSIPIHGGKTSNELKYSSVQSTLCNPMDCSMPGLPVHHQLPELTQIHAH